MTGGNEGVCRVFLQGQQVWHLYVNDADSLGGQASSML